MNLAKYFPTFCKLFRKETLPFWGLFLIAMLLICDRRLIVRKYQLSSGSEGGPVRIAVVTDLHNSRYGKNQKQLLNAITEQQPDLILLVGDIFSDTDSHENTERFLAGISGKYPCYYVTGNHEHRHGAEALAIRMDLLKKYGITILDGAYETINLNGKLLNICGVSDPTAHISQGELSFNEQLNAVNKAAANGYYTILLAHKPEFFPQYSSCNFDLVLCGHAHGGQWRIPFLMNGFIAPGQGFFPKYAGGEYNENGTTMILSRGLSRGDSIVPRIFNRPELVIIDLQ